MRLLQRIYRWLADYFASYRPRNPERLIFKFHDGVTSRAVDPLEILGRLQEHPDYDLKRDALDLDQGEIQTSRVVARVVREVFQIMPFHTAGNGDPVGLTDLECLEVLLSFIAWQEQVKKNSVGQLT